MKFNIDTQFGWGLVKKIVDRLEINDGYCPCNPNRTPETICPCKDMREKRECHCNLFVRTEE